MADRGGWYTAATTSNQQQSRDGSRSSSNNPYNNNSNKRSRMGLQYEPQTTNAATATQKKNPNDMRIPEVLGVNLEHAIEQQQQQQQRDAQHTNKIVGDVPSLILRTEYFMGIGIGWPFPEMNVPQKQMSIHILKALKCAKHVVLESPTGTGKSAALLCAVLAWQRHHKRTTGETVRILYGSRTHSQVQQMVQSLKQTPYRPNMTVLASRDKLCIHQHLPLSNNNTKMNVNQECRNRVKVTEGTRKQTSGYNDDHPSTYQRGDELEAPSKDLGTLTEVQPCCPHYRQLTATRTATLVHDRFRNSNNHSFGVHDLEDLVQFGRNPYQRSVVLRKAHPHEDWGLSLTLPRHAQHPKILAVSGPAAHNNNVHVGEWVFAIDKQKTTNVALADLVHGLRSNTTKTTITLTVGPSQTNDDESGSNLHSTCPYYISRALEKHAELVFCPYNYVLDPGIRDALGLKLENNIVILDEAHNVEDVLRNGGSGRWTEFQLCEMISALQYYAQATDSFAGTATIKDEMDVNHSKEIPVTVIAHELLCFLETIVLYLIDSKRAFEQNGGAQKALADWEKFRTPPSKEFEMQYYGPDGRGRLGKPQGCEGFFRALKISTSQADRLKQYAESMYENIQQRDNVEAQLQLRLFEEMVDVVTKLATAMDHSEHYYVQSAARVNGSFEFVAGASNQSLVSRGRNKPKPLPYAPGRSAAVPTLEMPSCKHCRTVSRGHELIYSNGAIRHGSFNNGATPPWEAVLVLDLLTPSLNMKELAQNCRSVILASGSLAPLPSLCAELGLSAAPEVKKNSSGKPLTTRDVTKRVGEILNEKTTARLQNKPPPLEASHVVNLNKQLLAVAIGEFPNGERLTVSYRHYQHDAFIEKLGGAVASVIESIPRGGVLVFLPSYSLLKRCIKAWNPESSYSYGGSFDYGAANIWSRFEDSKGKVIVEPSGSQSDFDAARQEYAEAIKSTGSCILFAVFRGKMSEGISFNDDNARGVICIGIPFPSSFDRAITAKKSYNDEQRKLGKREDVLSGNSWYNQQAYRALAQALGRCIRHAGDYGTVVLMDSRHCDESPPDQNGVCPSHRQFPKWMRAHVRTLTRSGSGSNHDKVISGGWSGLKRTMESFFAEAPGYTAGVLQKQQERLASLRSKIKENAANDDEKTILPATASSASASGDYSRPLTGGGLAVTLSPTPPTFQRASVTPSQSSQPSAVKSEFSADE